MLSAVDECGSPVAIQHFELAGVNPNLRSFRVDTDTDHKLHLPDGFLSGSFKLSDPK